VSWFLAFSGFAALIVLHELGHFLAAKAVGMRVERFALFFPPLLWKKRRGETEYGIGLIPLGGYVKISGMSPNEVLPPEVEDRAYYRQPVWKRVVVILAGPVMNLVVAFIIIFSLFIANGVPDQTRVAVGSIESGMPATKVLKPGDEIVSVNGQKGGPEVFVNQISKAKCLGKQVDGCVAKDSTVIVVKREGNNKTFSVKSRYDAKRKRSRLGFQFQPEYLRSSVSVPAAASGSASALWRVSKLTVKALGRVFQPEGRKQLSGVVGSYEVTRQAIKFDSTRALEILAFISLSLAIVNLFPFLPLDGGHIFWALAEKISGRKIPYQVLEKVSVIGIVLVAYLFFVGLTNDIGRLTGEGFNVK